MLPTLSRYIFREMGKNFLMTAVGLTAVLTTCGGLYNLTRLTDVGPGQTLLLMLLVVPMCAAITLPIAALFSATATYGRLASDNEFVACRSSGINPLTLLIPCVAISLLSAIITFAVFNFVIPVFMSQINNYTREGIKSYIVRTLQSGKHLEYQNKRVYAERLVDVDAISGNDEAVFTERLAFIEQEEDDIVRFGVGRHGVVKFDFSSKHPRIQADMVGVRVIDLKRNTTSWFDQEWIGPFEHNLPFRIRPKYLYLGDLLKYRDRPEDIIPKLQSKHHTVRRLVMGKLLFDYLSTTLERPGSSVVFDIEDGTLTLQAHTPKLLQSGPSQSRSLQLQGVQVVEDTLAEQGSYSADTVRIDMQYEDGQQPTISLQLNDVEQKHADGGVFRKKLVNFDDLAPPAAVVEQFARDYSDEQLRARNAGTELGEDIARQCKKLRKNYTKYRNEMYSEVHIRIVYSISVVALAVLGAMLSMVFRGGQLLVAFGISFVPAFFVLMMTILGKGAAKSDGMLMVGLSITWGGLLAVVILNVVVVRKYLPR